MAKKDQAESIDKEKVEFGFRYLFVMRELQLKSGKQTLDAVSDAAARMLLIHWGLSPGEIDEANKLFWERFNSNKLGELQDAFNKLKEGVAKDKEKVRKLIVDVATVAAMDMNLSNEEAGFLGTIQNSFDLRQSEVSDLVDSGYKHAVGLNFFGQEYLKAQQK